MFFTSGLRVIDPVEESKSLDNSSEAILSKRIGFFGDDVIEAGEWKSDQIWQNCYKAFFHFCKLPSIELII